MATCNICKSAGTPSYKSPCSECKGFSKYEYRKLQTNADRIRAMSDEELAKEMRSHAFALATCSEKAWLEWLQQPAEEE